MALFKLRKIGKNSKKIVLLLDTSLNRQINCALKNLIISTKHFARIVINQHVVIESDNCSMLGIVNVIRDLNLTKQTMQK